ncbi:MAG: DUF2273 domain-containing protein [Clostridia bacterium]|nr:DUF2273 domain-containing protein [Clostridia bacterium]MBQ2948376.1 DUF2273 domain-containing protein [Clostridia bacterium]MBQ4609189.1 DUF2273 domain-containing protein [Clostridia bacterium]MBQ6857915.1 DUF2273 domain-containing protein [Clostridia bacterium]MBQ7052096.1 DUF2273 domain-containing protein [Clostridia bacterium]
MDFKTFISQMLTPGTAPCTIFGVCVGLVFAVLCLTIGVGKSLLIGLFCLVGAFLGGVKDKGAFLRRVLGVFHRDDSI